jgi:hypothetical protein
VNGVHLAAPRAEAPDGHVQRFGPLIAGDPGRHPRSPNGLQSQPRECGSRALGVSGGPPGRGPLVGEGEDRGEPAPFRGLEGVANLRGGYDKADWPNAVVIPTTCTAPPLTCLR